MSTLLTNARVVDGTGAPAFDGFVLIDGETIAAVGPAHEPLPPADRVVDVGGRVVSPGFVDMHSHNDFLLPDQGFDGLIDAFLEQGVTSVVAGNCGLSAAPCVDATRHRLERMAAIAIDGELDWSWRTMGEYLDRLETAKPGVNVAQLVGHGAARYVADDRGRGALDDGRLSTAVAAAAQALDEGACGLSFGLGYEPGMYSTNEELVAFSKAAASRGKPITSHLKAYSWLSPIYPLTYLKPHNLRAIDEMIDVAKQADARLQISHFIFVGRNTWRTAETALGKIDAARREGADVMIDAFPYTCGNTTINVTLPPWFLSMGPAAYRSRAARLRLRAETEIGYKLVGFDWTDFQVMEIGNPEWAGLDGLTIAEIGRRWKMAPFEALLHISERTDGGAMVLIHGYSGDRAGHGPIADVLAHEACLYETDALVRSDGWPNPAARGTFPKILADQVRARGVLTLEEAIRRMTSASLERFGITDRGRVMKGLAADLVVFDADTIEDTPPGPRRPAGRPKGIAHVFVNGAEVVTAGARTGEARTGRVLRT
ncbi:MAG: amidohydrolase family protein [Sandaracinaceae bacterium]